MKKRHVILLSGALILSGCSTKTEVKKEEDKTENTTGTVKESSSNGVKVDNVSFSNDVIDKPAYSKTPKFTGNNLGIVKKSGPIELTLHSVQVSNVKVKDASDPINRGKATGTEFPIIQVKLEIKNTGPETVNFYIENSTAKLNNGEFYKNDVDPSGSYSYPAGYTNNVLLQFTLMEENINDIKSFEFNSTLPATNSDGTGIPGAEPVIINLDLSK